MKRIARSSILSAIIILIVISPISIADIQGTSSDKTNEVDTNFLPAYTAHDPIRIDSNFNLSSMATSEGWSGNGSENDPYLIENLSIDAGSDLNCLYIGNTTYHVVIRNCSFFNAKRTPKFIGDGAAVSFHNSSNILVVNNTLDKNSNGIYSASCFNQIIAGNSISNTTQAGLMATDGLNGSFNENSIVKSRWGIYLLRVISSTISGNTIENSERDCMVLGSSSDNDVDGNLMVSSYSSCHGFYMSYSNGNRIRYNHADVPSSGICYFITRNVENNTMIENSAEGGWSGLYVFNSDNLTCQDFITNNSFYGIKLYNSKFNTLQDVTVYNSTPGLSIENSGRNLIDNIYVDYCTTGGEIINSTGNTLRNVTIEAELTALSLIESNGNHIEANLLTYYPDPTVNLEESNGNRFENSRIRNTDGIAVRLVSSRDNEFHKITTFSENQMDFYVNGKSYGTRISSTTFGGWGIIFDDNRYLLDRDKLYSSTEITDTYLEGRGQVYLLKNTDFGGSSPVTGAGQIILYNVSNAVIHNQTIERVIEGLKIVKSANVTIRDSVQREPKYYGWLIMESTGISLVKNDLSASNVSNMIHSVDNFGLLLKGNSFHDSNQRRNDADEVVLMSSNRDTIITDNSFERIIGTGINAGGCDNTTLVSNRYNNITNGSVFNFCHEISMENEDLSDIENIGTTISNSDDIKILNTSVRNCSTYGIFGNGGVDNIKINKCRIFGNNVGIYGWDISDATFTASVVHDNKIGCTIGSSNGIKIERNLFYNNIGMAVLIGEHTKVTFVVGNSFICNNGAGFSFNQDLCQVQVDSSYEIFFNGDGSGNHWSDWSGYENDDNMDDIVDEPLLIPGPGNPVDEYPLVRSPYPLISQPGDFKVTMGYRKATLSWSAPDYVYSNLTYGYRIFKSVDGDPPRNIAELPLSVTTRIDTTNMGGESFSYFMVAYCELGEGARTDIIEVVPDNTEPLIEITFPEDQSIFNITEVLIEWTVDDPESEIQYNRIRIDEGEWMDVGKNTTYLVSGLSDGYHTVMVESVNEINLSEIEGIGFYVDSAPPTLELRIPDPSYTSDSDFRIRWDGHDETTILQRYYVNLNDDNWIDVGMDEQYELTLTREGPNKYMIRGIDSAGNEGIINGTVIYDTTPPILNITWPLDGSLHSDTSMTIRWDSSDQMSSIDYFGLKLDGEIYYGTEDPFYHILYLDEGDHEITVTSYDIAGNEGSRTVRFSIDRTHPMITDYFPKGVVTDIDVSIYIDLSEEMDEDLMDISVSSMNGTIFSIDNRWFHNRTDQLVYGSTYVVNVSGTDLAGNQLGSFTWDFSLSGDGNIYGIVLDWWGNPLAGADIFIDGKRVDRTDINGEYRFTHEMGDYVILISREGYEDYTGHISVEPGVTTDVGQSVMKREGNDENDLGFLWILVVIILLIIFAAAGVTIAVIFVRREISRRELISMDDREAMIDILKHFGIRTRLDQIDCYITLGLDTDANKKEIRSAYRRMAKRYHPDLMNSYGEDWEEMETKMREINAAKEILTDPQKREIHDRILKAYGK